jgi:lysophospholipase L1-like esterase
LFFRFLLEPPMRLPSALALCAALLFSASAGATELASTPLSRMDLPWWKARFAAKQQELRQHKVDLIWLGDSITQDFERHGPPEAADFAPVWQRFYGDRNAIDLGFMGDTTAHLLWRIENGETNGISPRAAVVLIGANNFGRLHWPAGPTLNGINAIVNALHQRLPHTRILLVSVLPSIRSAWVDENTAAVNQALQARYGDGKAGVTFVNVTHVFLKDGAVDRSLFLDPLKNPNAPALHPTAQAQARLAAAIEPELSRLMGDRNHAAP